jgi:hypothetical protein
MEDIISCHRIDVMNQKPAMNLMTWYSQIAPLVSYNDFITDPLPFERTIELLVHVPVEPEGLPSDIPSKTEVVEPAFESRDLG